MGPAHSHLILTFLLLPIPSLKPSFFCYPLFFPSVIPIPAFLFGSLSPIIPSLATYPLRLLPDLPSHLSLCSSLPVPLPQVSRIAAYAYSALSQIRVDAKEELVVQFGIP